MVTEKGGKRCVGLGRRIPGQVQEVLIFLVGNESPVEIHLPFMKQQPSLALLCWVCHSNSTAKSQELLGVEDGWVDIQ